ncbi:retrovirus-related pol polyprotein from transposon TNT 1-94 [Tanacetum coccineum]
MTIEMADRSMQSLKGIRENVLVKISNFMFPIYFVVLDIMEDENVPIILGRPMLANAHAMIDVYGKKISLGVGNDQVVFNINKKEPPTFISPICVINELDKMQELDDLVMNDEKKTLEKIEPYNLRLPALDDIRNLIHRRTVHEKIDKDGNTIHKLPNQIETNELFDHLRPCELVIRENVYSAIGNRDHTQAVIALMLYCLENRQPFNLAYFIIRRMYFFRDRRDKVLPYGMILTRLFKNLRANMAQGSFDERYKLVPKKISSLKAKQPKKPPPKRTRNVGKSKQTQLSTSSSTSHHPLIMEIFLATNFPRGHIVELL